VPDVAVIAAAREALDRRYRSPRSREVAHSIHSRNEGPEILDEAACRLTGEDLQDLVAGVWSGAEFPESRLESERWVELFRCAQYPFDLARLPLTVYRGTAPYRRRGMSWTTDIVIARRFADRWALTTGRAAFVYRTVLVEKEVDFGALGQHRISPVLCDVDVHDHGGRQEHEIVVDPDWLGKIDRMGRHIGQTAGADADQGCTPP
jgi:hypothetical protein